MQNAVCSIRKSVGCTIPVSSPVKLVDYFTLRITVPGNACQSSEYLVLSTYKRKANIKAVG